MLPLLYSAAAGLCVLVLPDALPLAIWPVRFPFLAVLIAGGLLCYWLAGLDSGITRWMRRATPLLFLAGYGYSAVITQIELDRRLPDCADAGFRSFSLSIESTPEVLGITERGEDVRFLARVSEISDTPPCAGLDASRVRLTWYSAPPLAKNQIWQVQGKLRPPWSYRNPGGFDYERWLLGQAVHGTGYVKAGHLLRESEPLAVDGWRAALSDWLATQPLSQPGLVRALMLGDGSGIETDQWQRLRDSGLIHVVIVSGLHVGIVAGLGFWLGLVLMRCLMPLTRRLGAHRLAIPFALVVSGAYVLLTGAAVPARRAWLFSAVVLLGATSSRRVSLPGVFGVVLLVVLVSQPLVVHQQGFWLSFIAVAVLLLFFGSRRSGRQARPLALLKAQLVLCIGLSPVLALIQGSIPVTAAGVNLLVVPMISVLVLPALLLSVVLAPWLAEPAAWLLWLADQLLSLTDRIAEFGARVSPLAAIPPPGWPVLILVSATLLLLCAPPARWLPLLLSGWLIWLVQPLTRPEPGAFRITAFDVGQGSAIHVQTNRHNLLFDTGPAFNGGLSLGEVAVVPGLSNLGVGVLDALVVSHADTDHSGGLEAVLGAVPARKVWSSFLLELEDVRADLNVPGSVGEQALCAAGVGWQWDGVDFAFLHPGSASGLSDNDRSCVLQISSGGRRAILAGDISRRVESRLLARGLCSVDLVMAPHHGSRSSSSPGWVSALSPETVFISAPRRSRFGHPHPDVVSRYLSEGAGVYVTGWSGALTWSSSSPGSVQQMRVDDPAYWRAPALNEARREPSRR